MPRGTAPLFTAKAASASIGKRRMVATLRPADSFQEVELPEAIPSAMRSGLDLGRRSVRRRLRDCLLVSGGAHSVMDDLPAVVLLAVAIVFFVYETYRLVLWFMP